jgi:hypothetical protein
MTIRMNHASALAAVSNASPDKNDACAALLANSDAEASTLAVLRRNRSLDIKLFAI